MYRAFDITPIAKILKGEGEELADDLKENVPFASGVLKESYRTTVDVSGLIVTLNLWAADHHIFVERGRGKKKRMPPLDAIRSWCMVKGIDVEYAWPIAMKIAEEGIEAKPILDQALAKKLPAIRDGLTDAFALMVGLESRNMMDELFPRNKRA